MFLFILFLTSLNLKSEEIKTIRAEEIWTIKNTGPKPYLSPDGSYVAWTKSTETEEDRFNEKIYIAKVGTEERIEIGKTKELFGWLNNEYLITQEGFLSIKERKLFKKIENIPEIIIKRADLIIPVNINLDKIEKIHPFWVIKNGEIRKVYSTGEPYNFVLFVDKSEIQRIILFQNGIPLYVNTKSRNNFVFGFIPSPLQDKFILRFFSEGIVIFPNENRIYSLPTGGSLSWSPDGKELIFARLEDNGHFETKGELFLCNWDGTNIRKIVFEKERIRREPSFGPPDMITYGFWDENRNLCIGVAKILRKH